MMFRNGFQHLMRFGSTLAFVLVLILGFQNCSRVNFGTGAPRSAQRAPSSAGNGTNYDGKPFNHTDASLPCADKNPNRSVIVLGAAGYKQVRKNCADVSPATSIAGSDISVDIDHPAIVTYQQEKYIFDASTLAAQVPDLDCKNKNFGPFQGVKIYSVTGSSGAMLTGVATFNGKSYNVAFDKSAIDTAPSSIMDAVNQEADLNIWLQNFDSTNSYPDASNTKAGFSQGSIGGRGYVNCLRPNGSL